MPRAGTSSAWITVMPLSKENSQRYSAEPRMPIWIVRVGSSTPSSTALRRSEEHTSELQSLMRISYAVFCLKKKKKTKLLRQNYKIKVLRMRSTRLKDNTHSK